MGGYFCEELTPEQARGMLMRGLASDAEYVSYFDQKCGKYQEKYPTPDICLAYPKAWEEEIREEQCACCRKYCWPDMNGYGFKGGIRSHASAFYPLFKGRPTPKEAYEQICNECWPSVVKYIIPLRDLDQLKISLNKLQKAINEKRSSNNRTTAPDAGERRQRGFERRP